MPRRDGTGPQGQGKRTGRGLGPCGDGQPRGGGQGWGHGGGVGYRKSLAEQAEKEDAAKAA